MTEEQLLICARVCLRIEEAQAEIRKLPRGPQTDDEWNQLELVRLIYFQRLDRRLNQ